MLSIKPFASSSNASSYYSHGDYYGSEGEGTWLGLGANELGLSGEFTAKTDQQFNNILNGILPNGQVLGRKTKDGLTHLPGVDLTFSAPKSFSIQMLVYSNPDERTEMEQALINAISSTLGYIEKHGYVVARKGKYAQEKEKLNKLTFATFMHTTNRNLEPQAHVHCFLANVATCSDGKFRSITIDKLLENNKLFGQIFRNELALETKKLGHEIKTTILSDGSSSFELSKIDPKLIKAFSTRRQEIEALFKLYGVTSKEGKDKIVINSRKAKQLVTKEQLSQAWQAINQEVKKEIGDHATTVPIKEPDPTLFQKLVRVFATENKSPDLNRSDPLTAADLAKLCVEDLTYNKTLFSGEELLKKTLKYAIGHFSAEDIHQEIDKLKQDGVLLHHDNHYTTKSLVDKEHQILKFAKNEIGTSKQIIKNKHFEAHCQKFVKRETARNPQFQMNNQQRKAIKHILTANDKIITMEGLPGVGKSTVLNAVRDITGKTIISLIGFGEQFTGTAPTASSAKTLKQSAQIDSQTLHSFLAKYQGYIEGRGSNESLRAIRQNYRKTLIFLDESSLVSTNLMYNLLTLQEKLGFRLVLTGDTKQLGAVEAGKPFEQILDIIKPVKLTQVVRQKDEQHKQAVVEASQGNISSTFAIHDKSINVPANKDLAKAAANAFLDKDSNQRDNTLLISPTKNLRDQINETIRSSLAKENSITGETHKFTAFRQKDMTSADYSFAPSYNIGDVVKFNRNYKNDIKKDDYLEVKAINDITNSLVLEIGGKELVFYFRQNNNYSDKLEVFTKIDLKLQEGLKIIFTRNNREFKLINSETAVIGQIGAKQITIKLDNGQTKSIPVNKLKHIDYGYCVTVHSSQGKTFDNTIAAIKNHKLLNNQKSWLVAISRHKIEFTAFIEDKNQLKTYLMKNKGDGVSAIEFQEKILQNQSFNSSGLQNSSNNAKIKEEAKLQLVI